MKNISFALILAGLFALAPASRAQVSAELVYDQEQYLSGEAITLGVKVKNFSGRTLHLGKDQPWLKFTVLAADGQVVARIGEVPVVHEFELETASAGTRRVDLAPYFAVSRAGRYKLTATVLVKELGLEMTTPPRYFEVVSGVKLWEQEFGVTLPDGTSETRKYTLFNTSGLRQPKLYARVSDLAESRVRVFAVGGILSFSHPELQVDKRNRLHILNQYASKSFNYCVVSPDADLLVHYTYEYTSSRPALNVDREGNIVVVGGQRRFTTADVPPSSPPVEAKKDESPSKQ
ncbi:MAG TPA: hypothetical protein VHH73_02730 [Verrucomicrobiae bacterium]|nr:hypothetical protein [Verrucomicrobiae bacterium]